MAKLTTAQRKKIPASQYGLPSKAKKGKRGGAPRGAYPMPDVQHAKTAKAYAQKEYDQGKLSKSDLLKIERKANRKIRAAGGKAAPVSTKKAGKSGKRR